MAVNNAVQLAHWADALYACDGDWWKQYNPAGYRGLRISQDGHVPNPEWGLHLVTLVRNCDQLLFNKFGELGWGGNGGFHALNLALQFGARRIILVGYDMRVDLGVHFHGKHPKGMNNPAAVNVRRWRQILDAQAPLLAGLGVEVLNASPVSALEAYPKVDFAAAVGATLNAAA